MALIEELRLDAVQRPHAEGNVAVRGLDKNMIVVLHEAIGMTDPVVVFVDVPEGVQEVPAVHVILKTGFFSFLREVT
jgi:hypothetical protein